MYAVSKSRIINRKNYLAMAGFSLMLVVVMFLINGCAGKQIRLERQAEVKKTFQEVDIDPKEYAFFTAGPKSTPEAILLVKNQYLGEFDSSGWKLRDKQTIMDLLKSISEATRPGKQYGFPVVTEEGGPVKGLMFTAFPHGKVFIDEEQGVFRVATPAMLDTGQGTFDRTSCSISVCQ